MASWMHGKGSQVKTDWEEVADAETDASWGEGEEGDEEFKEEDDEELKDEEDLEAEVDGEHAGEEQTGGSWQGSGLSQELFFKQQDEIPVEISPEEPGLVPLKDMFVSSAPASSSRLNATLVKAVQAAGYKQPTPVQKWGIPLLLKGKDVMACAQTGSGKTAFYLLPAINKTMGSRQQGHGSPAAPSALVMGPTRELCVQIFEEAQKFTQGSQVRCAVCYGGTEYRKSLQELQGGVDILVATPGRLQDLCDRNACSLWSVQSLVLDEADRMLDMGFEPQIRKIVQKSGMPKNRQTVMTSATFPAEVQHLAQDFMKTYSFMAVGRVGGAASTVQQRLEWAEDNEKDDLVYGLLLHQAQLGLTLVFVNQKQSADDLQKLLMTNGMQVESIHGDRSQEQREQALESFKAGTTPILIATDVAARGLDIPDVALVIQYDLAMGVDDYVHRVGRTGRIGKRGIAVGLINNKNKGMAGELVNVLQDAGSPPPPFLVGMAISSGNYNPGGGEKDGDPQYGGQDVRRGKQGFKTLEDREKAKRVVDYAANAYGQGDSDRATKMARTVGPAQPGAYAGSAAKGGKSKGGKGGKDKGGGKGSWGGGGKW